MLLPRSKFYLEALVDYGIDLSLMDTNDYLVSLELLEVAKDVLPMLK